MAPSSTACLPLRQALSICSLAGSHFLEGERGVCIPPDCTASCLPVTMLSCEKQSQLSNEAHARGACFCSFSITESLTVQGKPVQMSTYGKNENRSRHLLGIVTLIAMCVERQEEEVEEGREEEMERGGDGGERRR